MLTKVLKLFILSLPELFSLALVLLVAEVAHMSKGFGNSRNIYTFKAKN